MFFFFLGSGGTTSEVIGDGYTVECPNCHNVRRWPVIKSMNRASVFFVPIAKWGAKYWTMCPVCDLTAQLASEEQAQQVLQTADNPDPALYQDLLRRAEAGYR